MRKKQKKTKKYQVFLKILISSKEFSLGLQLFTKILYDSSITILLNPRRKGVIHW